MNKTALLVEHDLEVLADVAAMFNLLGYRVTSVRTGAEAIERLSSQRFDVMLVDAMLAGHLDGVALARAACKVCFQMKILIGSALSEDALRQHGYEDGFILLPKPYTPDAIAAHIAASALPAAIADMARTPVMPLSLLTGSGTLDPVPETPAEPSGMGSAFLGVPGKK